MILAWIAIADRSAWGQATGSPTEPANLSEATGNSTEDVDPGNIDKLLAAADKDLGQLSRVDVGHTGSPSLDMPVSTAERRESTVGQTPAAVYVVTNEMIRRSGARNIPEVLRTVPGVQVARINASAWAITIRGMDARFANKLLVQIDGVAIYSPSHSGVFWEREYVMLEDVDRIEVIRGPGAAVWGVNAVNGVINIVTKSAKDTKGIYADAGGGDLHRQFGDLRVGGQSGNLHWRTYGMTLTDGMGYPQPNQIAFDNPTVNQGGFRTDWTPTKEDTLTVQGDFYGNIDRQWGSYASGGAQNQMDCKMARSLVRWSRQIDEDTDWAVQLYYYNPYANGPNKNSVSAFDSDIQYHAKRGRHDMVFGGGFRNYDEKFVSGAFDMNDGEQIPSYFLQDTITLVEERYFLTLGSKFDHNSVTTFEMQPTARLMWTPDKKTSIWTSISRAARTPSLVERPRSNPTSEDLMAYEAGFRRAPTENFYWDLAVFFNQYSDLLGYPSTNIYGNYGVASVYGMELSSTYTVTQSWRLTGSYCPLYESFEWPTGITPGWPNGTSPRNQFYLQSGWDIGRDITLDMMFRYMDSLPVGVPAYFAGDIRCAWRPRKNIELSAVGQNLFCGQHYEFISMSSATPTQIGPSAYGMISWRY
jgi:iron complex outermembrane receptor protein